VHYIPNNLILILLLTLSVYYKTCRHIFLENTQSNGEEMGTLKQIGFTMTCSSVSEVQRSRYVSLVSAKQNTVEREEQILAYQPKDPTENLNETEYESQESPVQNNDLNEGQRKYGWKSGRIHFQNSTFLILQSSNQAAEKVPSRDLLDLEDQDLIITNRQEYYRNNATELLQRSHIPPK